ncbi:hypothetical protein pVa21_096 [Vibrio phage pVa-21]|nr:hypothetical protein pVa21_096 [Vibrio phage pVa-21]
MDKIVTGQPYDGVGYHWRERDDTEVMNPREFDDSRGFYLCDDPYSWGSPHLSGTHAVVVEYRVDNPYVDRDNKEIYEFTYHKSVVEKLRKEGYDAIVYVSDQHNDLESGRQLYLLNPSTQIKSIKPLTFPVILDAPRQIEDRDIPVPEFNTTYPLAVYEDVSVVNEQHLFSNYSVYYERDRYLDIKPLRELLRRGQSAKDYFYEAGKLNFRNALNFLHLSQYGRNAEDFGFADEWFDRLREHLIDEDSIVSDDNTAISTIQRLNDKVRELTTLLENKGNPKDIARLQKEVDELNAQALTMAKEVDIVSHLGDEPLFEEGEIEAIANKAIAEVHAEERYNRKIDEQTAIRMGALTLAEVDRMAYDAAGFSSPSYDTALLAGEMAPHPVQPVYEDENGTVRFKPNPIIRDLQEAGVLDLNKIAGKYDKKDISQLNQLIGYSVDGWWYLSTTSQMDKIKAAMQEERRKAFDSIDGEINYLRKKDDITPIDAIHVTMDAEQYPLPIELPILFQRMTKFDGHYSLSVNSKDSWEVEWVDSSFHGHCSYNLTPDSPDGTPEFPVGTINLKVNENHLWLEKIGEPDSGQAILTFNWPQVSEQLSRGKCELPTVVNFGISKLLTNYGTFTKASADFQGIYQMCQAVLRFMASRKFILDNLTPELFEPELYAKLFKAASYGPVKDNTAVNKLLKATQRAGVRGQIQTAFKHIANSEILFEESKIHLETDRAVYDAHTTELEELIKQYL